MEQLQERQGQALRVATRTLTLFPPRTSFGWTVSVSGERNYRSDAPASATTHQNQASKDRSRRM